MYRHAIVEKALQNQYQRNRNSAQLRKVYEVCADYFPYIKDKEEIKVLQDRVSDYFNINKSIFFDKWNKKLKFLFADVEQKTANKLTAVFNLDDYGIPDSFSVQPAESAEPATETYTITVRKDSTGDVVFSMNNIDKSITMTSISEITKALS